MRMLALALAFAPVLLAAPTAVHAEGNCPASWELWLVGQDFPADRNANGIVCVKYRYGNPNDDLYAIYFRDDH
jgi:hypothetical protein